MTTTTRRVGSDSESVTVLHFCDVNGRPDQQGGYAHLDDGRIVERSTLATTPRHRRELPDFVDLRVADVQNWAECVDSGWSHCRSSMCARHYPVAYADAMARHATDSI